MMSLTMEVMKGNRLSSGQLAGLDKGISSVEKNMLDRFDLLIREGGSSQ